MKRNPSLQNRLLATLLPLTLITVLLASTIIYTSIRNKVEELTNGQLVQTANVLKNLISHEIYEQEFQSTFAVDMKDLEFIYQSFNGSLTETIVFQVRNMNHDLLIRTKGAPLTPLSETQSGFSRTEIRGAVWKVYSLPAPEAAITIQVALKISFLDQLKGNIALQTLIPLLAMLPILGMTIVYGVRSATIPLRRLSADIKQRQPDDLDRIATGHLPQEIIPLIDAFNTLLDRVREAISNERRFTDNAAHELRTPLAGIRLQAQLALRSSTDDETRQQALTSLIEAVDRTTHLVQQLLVLARLTSEQARKDNSETSLREAAARSISDLYEQAQQKNIRLTLSENCEGIISVNPNFISILINNLLGNALQYTPQGGEVAIDIEEHDDTVSLLVSDSGPGIPKEERQRVLERFYRIPGSPGPGCGLGYSIVQRIIKLYQGKLQLDRSRLGGHLAKVDFPRRQD